MRRQRVLGAPSRPEHLRPPVAATGQQRVVGEDGALGAVYAEQGAAAVCGSEAPAGTVCIGDDVQQSQGARVPQPHVAALAPGDDGTGARHLRGHAANGVAVGMCQELGGAEAHAQIANRQGAVIRTAQQPGAVAEQQTAQRLGTAAAGSDGGSGRGGGDIARLGSGRRWRGGADHRRRSAVRRKRQHCARTLHVLTQIEHPHGIAAPRIRPQDAGGGASSTAKYRHHRCLVHETGIV
eukprot:ctg_627.g309